MNNIYFLKFTDNNWDYDEIRAGIVIAGTSEIAKRMMNDKHYYYVKGKWLSAEIVEVRHIGVSELEPQIVLVECHEG